ncbi:MAG: hypothetical protein V1743_03880 [Nanoarchaeota archaeon]
MEAREVKRKDYVIHNKEPCMVLANQIVVCGTHSHSKNRLELQGMFSAKSYELTLGQHDHVEGFQFERRKAQIIAKQEESWQIMDLLSYETFEGKPNKENLDVLSQLSEGDKVLFLNYNGTIIILDKAKETSEFD